MVVFLHYDLSRFSVGRYTEDSRFRTNTDRIEYRYELIGLISDRMRTQPSAYWIEVLEACGVLCGPINGMQEVFAHPQILHRGMKVAVPGSEDPATMMLGNPLKLSRTGVEYRMAPPVLGAHTCEILAQHLGMSQDDIDELLGRQVVAR